MDHRTQLNNETVSLLTIQFGTSNLLAHNFKVQQFYLTHRTLLDAITPGQSESGSNGNEEISHILQSPNTETSPSEGFVFYPGHLSDWRLTQLQICSKPILQPQPTGHFIY